MSTAAKIILFATPVFLFLIAIELLVDRIRGTKYYRLNDSVASLSLGVFSRTHRLIILSLATIVYAWLVKALSIPQLPQDKIWVWVLGFVFYDFLYYWFHRMSHQINFLWAGHVVHHQSEEFNLSTALRQSSSGILSWIFYLPSFIIGIPPEVFFVSGALNLVYQFWVHTRHINTLGFLEKILVTPSHHRVHHGQNELYIDKNHGGVFIIWDKLFGTFQQEEKETPVIYGVRRPLKSLNPIWANVHTWSQLFKDAIHTRHWTDKFKIWFMPTGWRPKDVQKTHPIKKADLALFKKYNPATTTSISLYAFVQFILTVTISTWFISVMHHSEFSLRLIFWIILTLPLITISMLLENQPRSKWLEYIRLFVTALLLFYFQDELSQLSSVLFSNLALLFYLLISFVWLTLSQPALPANNTFELSN